MPRARRTVRSCSSGPCGSPPRKFAYACAEGRSSAVQRSENSTLTFEPSGAWTTWASSARAGAAAARLSSAAHPSTALIRVIRRDGTYTHALMGALSDLASRKRYEPGEVEPRIVERWL